MRTGHGRSRRGPAGRGPAGTAWQVEAAHGICHKWSEKAKREMRDKQFKRAKAARAAKNPEQDFKDSLYDMPGGGFGFPAVGFKSAAVDACSQIESITAKLGARSDGGSKPSKEPKWPRS